MRLGRYLSGLTRPELDDLKYQLNLTDDEEKVFEDLAKGRSITKAAENCVISPSTVSNRSRKIKEKLNKLKVGEPDDRADRSDD